MVKKQELNDKALVERIINLRENRDWSQKDLADRLDMNKVTMNKIENMNRAVTLEELTKMAGIFNVSTDYLLGQSEKRHHYELTEKDEKDIAKQAEDIINGIDTKAGLSFYGETATEEQLQSMRDIIETGLRINKEKAKKKFTTKKYRDSSGD